MPIAIVTSNTQSKHSHLLTLNIIGVLICIYTEVLLVLTALGVIFVEPDISPVLQAHVNDYAMSCLAVGKRRTASEVHCCQHQDFEEEYLFHLNSTSLFRGVH